MIFVTVGTQLPFPRLIQTVDDLAEGLSEDVVAQVGPDTTPRAHLSARPMLTPSEFDTLFRQARVIIGHAGIGTVLSARRFEKPVILVPRRHDKGEHRNDHQLATVKALKGAPGIYIAENGEEIAALLSQELSAPSAAAAKTESHASLIAELRRLITMDS
ncbi:glycosyltransferase-like protein (PssE) [Parvularcula bermudensis HTCC2503]|uniref:Glycosyltransferase-like protein (PssE) n=1 Tax=Parvularcula bermudensis (strain ATCC BAA-594 / HTCC2503 / KCTC 12087) TaxID=314260 RepID=E0TDQ3_PARBH|nr:glycosyltransferase [Parvularcula bermudensis]ADM09439.1 glycosyltransferase-like protein (PssE) [Parvularcula bermudensis HTCC2503]